jgi:hypothetical protein
MKSFLPIFVSVFLMSCQSFGQPIDSLSLYSTAGVELDALPFITGGYYGSCWYGIDHVRFRGVITQTTIPEFVVPAGFKNNRLNVAAFIVDYFPRQNLQGWWIGSGLELWNATIEHDKEQGASSYSNTIFTVGGGFVWTFYKNFYLNPWTAVHLLVAGNRHVPVGSTIYDPPLFTAEVSIKVGWYL